MKIPATCLDLFLDHSWKRLGRVEPVASRQAVAKEENGVRTGFRLLDVVPGSCQGHATHMGNAGEQHKVHDTGHMQTTPILDVQHVSKTYHTGAGPLAVFKDISF